MKWGTTSDLEGPEPDSEVMLLLQSVSRCSWGGGGFKQLTLRGGLLNSLSIQEGQFLLLMVRTQGVIFVKCSAQSTCLVDIVIYQ